MVAAGHPGGAHASRRCGHPGLLHADQCGTDLATGSYPARYDVEGQVTAWLPAKDVRVFGGTACVLETALARDFAFVKSYRADRLGNLAFRLASRNFNVPAAMAGPGHLL